MPATTFRLNSVYRLLGLRSPRTVPEVAAGQVVPVIQMANVESFAPPSIEARSIAEITFSHSDLLNPSSWTAVYLHSLSAGGVVIEQLELLNDDFIHDNLGVYISRAPGRPWIGGLFKGSNEILETGGLPRQSLVNKIVQVPGLFPRGDQLGGSMIQLFHRTGMDDLISKQAAVFRDTWVAPGEFWWLVFVRGLSSMPSPSAVTVNLRWREIPESLGAA